MKEKTQQLRDIFMEVADDETVTERQEETRGSLRSDVPVEDRLGDVVAEMRDRYAFRTDLDTDALVAVVRGVHEDRDDDEIAEDLDTDAATVRWARLDLHLVTDGDLDAPVDLDAFRAARTDAADVDELAAEFDVDRDTARWYDAVIEAQSARRLVADRFRDDFREILDDVALSDRLTAHIRETGLEDATEGMETNTAF